LPHLFDNIWESIGFRLRKRQENPDMLDEYDFSDGVRGKHAERYSEGTNIVVLPPDVAEVFPPGLRVGE
jgi:hypothetical protein